MAETPTRPPLNPKALRAIWNAWEPEQPELLIRAVVQTADGPRINPKVLRAIWRRWQPERPELLLRVQAR